MKKTLKIILIICWLIVMLALIFRKPIIELYHTIDHELNHNGWNIPEPVNPVDTSSISEYTALEKDFMDICLEKVC